MSGAKKIDIAGKGTLELSGGVLRLRWIPGAAIGADDVKSAFSALTALGRGAKLPVLIEIHGVTHSPAARKVYPNPELVSRMALLGSSPVDHVVAMFRLPLLPTGFPVRYFTSAEKALTWLREAPEEPGAESGPRFQSG